MGNGNRHVIVAAKTRAGPARKGVADLGGVDQNDIRTNIISRIGAFYGAATQLVRDRVIRCNIIACEGDVFAYGIVTVRRIRAIVGKRACSRNLAKSDDRACVGQGFSV